VNYKTSAGTVLYIDDDPLNLRLVRKSLSHMGYAVHEAMEARQGLQLARQIQPDVILMDVHLPGMDGLEATEYIKNSVDLCHIPVIALTADVRETTREETRTAGCDAHLLKPISRARLLKVVGQFCQQAQVS
jgi:two-component system cell cycle response regulator DivK